MTGWRRRMIAVTLIAVLHFLATGGYIWLAVLPEQEWVYALSESASFSSYVAVDHALARAVPLVWVPIRSLLWLPLTGTVVVLNSFVQPVVPDPTGVEWQAAHPTNLMLGMHIAVSLVWALAAYLIWSSIQAIRRRRRGT